YHLPARKIAETDFEHIEIERRVEVVAIGPLAREVVDPGDDAAVVIDVVVERHGDARLVAATADLVAGVEIEQRPVEDRVRGACLRGGRKRAGRGVAIRHVNAKAKVLLDLRKKPAEARMRLRRQGGDDVEALAVAGPGIVASLRADLFPGGDET